MKPFTKSSKALMITLLLAILMCIVFPDTGAWFTSSSSAKNDGTTLRFGSIQVTINGVESDNGDITDSNFTFDPEDLIAGNEFTKILTFKNSGTANMYVRFVVTITDGDGNAVTVTNGNNEVVPMITYTVDGAWTSTTDSSSNLRYFYGTSTNGTIIKPQGTATATLNFAVSEAFGNDFSDKTIKINVTAESTQSDNQSAEYSKINW